MLIFYFLSISLLVSFGFAAKKINEHLLPWLVIAMYTVSLLPSLPIPYIIDDTDHLFTLSKAMESSGILRWLFIPHNEHVIPFLKTLYFLFYKYFWLNAQPFHLAVITVAAGILVLGYRLVFILTKCKNSALLGVVLLSATNLPDMSLLIITNAHINFCLFFLLLLFYAQYQYYFSAKKTFWAFVMIISAMLAPSSFALGNTSIIFAFLFQWWCIPRASIKLPPRTIWYRAVASSLLYRKEFSSSEENFILSSTVKKPGKSMMLFVSIGWCLGLLPYLFAFKQILYSNQYQFLGATSAFEIMHVWEGFKYLIIYFYSHLIPNIFPNFLLSIGILFLAISSGIKYRKSVHWKGIAFFLISGISYNLIIYIFRVAWGPLYLSVSRYDVFPSLMLCLAYATLLSPLIKNGSVMLSQSKYRLIFCLGIFLLVCLGAVNRHQRAKLVSDQTLFAVQSFYAQYHNAVKNYFHEFPETTNLTIKDSLLVAPRLPSMATPKGFMPDPTRYPRLISFYTQYVIPSELRNRLSFGNATDARFIDYLNDSQHKNAYTTLSALIQ